MKAFFVLFSVIISTAAFGEVIYFKLLNDNVTVSFYNNQKDVDQYVYDIAFRSFKRYFTPNMVDSEYYQIKVDRDLVWQGQKIVQYDYTPAFNDRFRHVIWTNNEGAVIKLEKYDLDERLVYSALCVSDCDKVVNTYKYGSEKIKGFSKVFSFYSNSESRISFSDGLNNFSIFRKVMNESPESPKDLMVYGNNVHTSIYNDHIYTVVGTIPLNKMQEIVIQADEQFNQDKAISINQKRLFIKY